MKVSYEWNKGIMKFHFTPEQDDKTFYQIVNTYKKPAKISLGRKTCEIHLPQNWSMDSTHPDLLALAAIAIIYPFIGSKITVAKGISNHFHNTFKKATGKEILPVNPKLTPRKAKENFVPALAYSGGVDSTAASILLPKNTHHLYIDRITPKDLGSQRSLLNQEAAFFACNSMKKLGRTVHLIKTDFPYVRNPVGFHTFLAESAPSILLADYYGFDSLSNGHTIEEGYQVGTNGYQDAKEGPVIKIWDELLKAIDMPYCLPTIGLSEVCTSKIVMNSPCSDFAQACSRGKIQRPCMNCYKCFRKTLLEKAIKKETLNDQTLNRLFKIKDAQQMITTTPIHFENVMTYISSQYKGNHPIMNLLKKKTRGDKLNTSWMEKWNPLAIQFIAPKYQQYVKNEISKYVQTMNKQDEENMKNFNYQHLTKSSEFTSYTTKLKQSLLSLG